MAQWSFANVASETSAKTSRERATGIEPAFSAWEADVLPLNYARLRRDRYGQPVLHDGSRQTSFSAPTALRPYATRMP